MSSEGEEQGQRLSWRGQLRFFVDTLLFVATDWVNRRAIEAVVSNTERELNMSLIERDFWFVEMAMPNYVLSTVQPRKRGSQPYRALTITVDAVQFDKGPVVRLIALPETVRITSIASTSSGYSVQFFDSTSRILRVPCRTIAMNFVPPEDRYIERIEITREPTLVGRPPFSVQIAFEPAVAADEQEVAS